MSRDGYLPDGVTEDMLPGNRPEDQHEPGCGQHEDADEVFECGGHNEHICGLIQRAVGCKQVVPDCICADIRNDAEASKADAAETRAEERRYAR